MTTALLLLAFALAHLAAVASPGPSFVVVVKSTLTGRRVEGVWCAFGMGLGTLNWAAAAWFGLAALFGVVPWLYTVLKLAGACYLIYLAIQLWRHAGQPLPVVTAKNAAGVSHQGALRAVRLGLLTQLANPKVAVFFGSIFLALLPPEPSHLVLAAVFLIVFVNEFAWYSLVALVIGAEPVRVRYARVKALVDRGTGLVLGGLGIRLAGS